MKITVTLSIADAHMLIKILSGNKDAAAIVSAIKAVLSKDKASAINKLIM